MVIWYLNWTVFCQFLICLIFIDLSGWLMIVSSWGRLLCSSLTDKSSWMIKTHQAQAWKSVQKNCIINVNIQNDGSESVKFCPVHSATHYCSNCTVHNLEVIESGDSGQLRRRYGDWAATQRDAAMAAKLFDSRTAGRRRPEVWCGDRCQPFKR